VAEADGDGLLRFVRSVAGQAERGVDDRREVLVRADVGDARPGNEPGREDAAGVGVARLRFNAGL